MHEAAKLYGAQPTEAAAMMAAASERFTADAAALGDADLPVEVELAAALTKLMQEHASQGTLYGE